MVLISLQVFQGNNYQSLHAGRTLYKQCSGKRHIIFKQVSEFYLVVNNFESSCLTDAVQYESY